jgi:hypothetical protein
VNVAVLADQKAQNLNLIPDLLEGIYKRKNPSNGVRPQIVNE